MVRDQDVIEAQTSLAEGARNVRGGDINQTAEGPACGEASIVSDPALQRVDLQSAGGKERAMGLGFRLLLDRRKVKNAPAGFDDQPLADGVDPFDALSGGKCLLAGNLNAEFANLGVGGAQH